MTRLLVKLSHIYVAHTGSRRMFKPLTALKSFFNISSMSDQHKKEITNEPLRKSKRLRKESIDNEGELSPKLQKLDQQAQDTLTHSDLENDQNETLDQTVQSNKNDLEEAESLPDFDHSDIDELTDSINDQLAIESNENEEQLIPLKEELIIDQQQIDTTSVDQEDAQSIIDIMEHTSGNENDGETESDNYFGSEEDTDTQSIRHEAENEGNRCYVPKPLLKF